MSPAKFCLANEMLETQQPSAAPSNIQYLGNEHYKRRHQPGVQLGMLVRTCNPRAQEPEAGRSLTSHQPGLYRKFKSSLGFSLPENHRTNLVRGFTSSLLRGGDMSLANHRAAASLQETETQLVKARREFTAGWSRAPANELENFREHQQIR